MTWDNQKDAYDGGFDDGFWVAFGLLMCLLGTLGYGFYFYKWLQHYAII